MLPQSRTEHPIGQDLLKIQTCKLKKCMEDILLSTSYNMLDVCLHHTMALDIASTIVYFIVYYDNRYIEIQ